MKTLLVNSNFLGLGKENSSYDNSKIVIYSAPLEKTVSYGTGTRNGPKEILKASHYVEFFDEEFNRELCFEKGIATLPIQNFDKYSSIRAINKIERDISKFLDDDKFVVMIGGEHSVTLGAVKAFNKHFDDFSILQFDAHSDLRDSYEGTKYSHASVMKRVYEVNQNICQVGIRAQCREEREFISEKGINSFYAHSIRNLGNSWHRQVVKSLKKNVYITFDVDGFDPAVIAATGTPEPGGLLWDNTIELIKLLGKEKNIVGFDIVELAPSKYHTASNYNSAKLLYKILNCAFQS